MKFVFQPEEEGPPPGAEGGKPLDVPEDVNVSHHTPDFDIDESGTKLGVRTLLNLTLDIMETGSIQS
ncbi:MAG: hypothetical protein BMS9Abin05_1598 [Rhodothermia bacterium]|nr:MAG: hypothetical protein BMS9Abin05_1598 [Rhodothermia bacterium]